MQTSRSGYKLDKEEMVNMATMPALTMDSLTSIHQSLAALILPSLPNAHIVRDRSLDATGE